MKVKFRLTREDSERIKHIILKKENIFYISERIIRAWKLNQYASANIVGPKGKGKTVFALQIMAQVFHHGLKYDVQKSWDEAINHLLFTKRDMINFIKLTREEPEPVVCWDDVRAHASGMSYFDSPKEVKELQGYMDTIRNNVSGFITTSPSISGVLKFITNEPGGYTYQIRNNPNTNNPNDRLGKGYIKSFLPSGTMKLKLSSVETYNGLLPNDIYLRARKLRSKYIHQIKGEEENDNKQ